MTLLSRIELLFMIKWESYSSDWGNNIVLQLNPVALCSAFLRVSQMSTFMKCHFSRKKRKAYPEGQNGIMRARNSSKAKYTKLSLFSPPLTHWRKFTHTHTEKCTITFSLYITSGPNIAQFIWKQFWTILKQHHTTNWQENILKCSTTQVTYTFQFTPLFLTDTSNDIVAK